MDPVESKTEAWPAPAKINLFLHIIGQRTDGYHLLQTAFQFLDVCDELHFSLNQKGEITRNANYGGVAVDDDLVVRAAIRLRDYTGADFGVNIDVDKRIPMGGGLGGGSSNAATTLVALNKLCGLGLSEDELAAIGLELGADVPVFVRGRAAWAEGVGEVLTPIEPPQDWLLLVTPDCHVETAAVFKADNLTRNTPAITIRDFLAGAGRNDCENVVRQQYPEVAEILDYLGNRYSTMMTGTGACVYARFQSREALEEAADALPGEWNYHRTQGRNVSPLLARLDADID